MSIEEMLNDESLLRLSLVKVKVSLKLKLRKVSTIHQWQVQQKYPDSRALVVAYDAILYKRQNRR